ncbi:hypothetical protein HD553DRAFT_275011, partial [Filobasidium floriforme]|uniref:uncharacterized protein n=1 Tax=Filobasidium floriforme TaxID=5210 RepID=UPI001E8D878F
HGVKRSRIDAQAQAAKQKEDAHIRDTYAELVEQCWMKRSAKEYSLASLAQTTKVLDINPEFYTIWNFRREILLGGLLDGQVLTSVTLLQQDLKLTVSYLQIHPKVYWIWTHRKWCLERMPDDIEDHVNWKQQTWKAELGLVEKMLERDARNFHAWDYRRHVLASGFPNRGPDAELKYTTKKIEGNFSNFSAWHQRTKVLGSLWEDMQREGIRENLDEIERMKQAEFELVLQALWTDPGDQSGWLYHRWLKETGEDELILGREIDNIRELLDVEPDAKWPLDSLVHYSMLQLGRHGVSDASMVKLDIERWLSRLQQVDPFRRRRYAELRKSR